MESRKERTLIGILAIIVLLFIISGGLAYAEDVIIVCNKSVTASSLSQDDIRDIFLGRKTVWDDGQKISFVTMKDGQAHETFLETFVRKTAMQFDLYWKKQVFTGRARTPKAFSTSDGIIDFIERTDGAIGYIPATALEEDLKIIKSADEKKPNWIAMLFSMAF